MANDTVNCFKPEIFFVFCMRREGVVDWLRVTDGRGLQYVLGGSGDNGVTIRSVRARIGP